MVTLRQLLIKISILATLVVSCALAQNLTQILDTITNPDGTPFNGTVVITWNGYSGTGSGTVSRLSTSARVFNGALSVLLVPTTTASPGTYYQVVYNSSNGLVAWTEVWQVPPSSTALTLSQVRQSSTAGSGTGSGTSPTGGQYATLPIAISQVTNLASSLSSINNAATTLGTTVSGLNTTVTGLSGTVTGVNTTVTGLNTTVTGLSSTVTGLNSTVTGLGSTVTGLNTTVAGLSGTVTGLNTTVAGLSGTLTTQGNSITTLNSTVNSQGASLGALSTTVSGHTSSLTSVSTSVTNLTNSVNALNTTVNSLSGVSATAAFVDAETPAGSINGTNAAFSLANPPAPAASLMLFRNGVAMAIGTDFTLNGSAITFTSVLPRTGDALLAYYRMVGTSSTTNFTDNETPAGSVNGTNLAFALSAAPNPSASLRLYRNGLLLALGSDYTLSGSAITFVSASKPLSGDSLAAYYRH